MTTCGLCVSDGLCGLSTLDYVWVPAGVCLSSGLGAGEQSISNLPRSFPSSSTFKLLETLFCSCIRAWSSQLMMPSVCNFIRHVSLLWRNVYCLLPVIELSVCFLFFYGVVRTLYILDISFLKTVYFKSTSSY